MSSASWCRQFGRLPRTGEVQAGDHVRTKNIHPATHTRLPRYARVTLGVERDHGCQCSGLGRDGLRREPAMALHRRVRRGRIMGSDADPTVKISIDAFEPYLEAA